MSHYLTWDSGNITDVKVNGTSVSQNYQLQDGDVIEAYAILLPSYVIYVNNEQQGNSTISKSDCDIYIDYVFGGSSGGTND